MLTVAVSALVPKCLVQVCDHGIIRGVQVALHVHGENAAIAGDFLVCSAKALLVMRAFLIALAAGAAQSIADGESRPAGDVLPIGPNDDTRLHGYSNQRTGARHNFQVGRHDGELLDVVGQTIDCGFDLISQNALRILGVIGINCNPASEATDNN